MDTNNGDDLTRDQACEFLGISKSLFSVWLHRGRIPGATRYPGTRTVVVSRRALEQFRASGALPTKAR